MTVSGLLVALGVLIPFVVAHGFGVPGVVFLPMHIPVFLLGMLCGPLLGGVGGIIIPVLSSLLTGMPVAFPMLPLMMGELFTYGLIIGLMSKLIYSKMDSISLARNNSLRSRIIYYASFYPALLVAQLGGRLVYATIFTVLLTAGGGNIQALSVTAAFVRGLPGLIIQWTLLPTIAIIARRHLNRHSAVPIQSSGDKLIAEARQIIGRGQASCVVIKGLRIIHTADGRGVSPLVDLYENNPQKLAGALVVDKVIGKAAAIIIVLGGASFAYGELMSAAAREFLTQHGVKVESGRCLNVISNRAGNGICPLEMAVLDVNDSNEGYTILKETMARLRAAG